MEGQGVKEKNVDHDFQKHLVDGETTADHLLKVLKEVEADCKAIPGFEDIDDKEYLNLQRNIDCDEVYPNIYIGDAITAKNKSYLEMIGVTHVLNAAEGNGFSRVNTGEKYYSDTHIKYLGLPLTDYCSTDISKFFETAASFIESGLACGGKVFVHCLLGVSRSATCVLAYLMIKKGMLATEAVKIVRKNRNIYPNRGFLHQLATLDNQLRRQRLP